MADRGPIGSIAELLFTDYLFPFELTSALLITAATGAMVLTHIEKAPGERKTQRQRVHERMRSRPDVAAARPRRVRHLVVERHAGAAAGRLDRARLGVRLVEFSESERVASRFRSGGSLTEIESAEHPTRADDDADEPVPTTA